MDHVTEVCLYRSLWLLVLVTSLAAFIYTSADCLLDYMTSHDNGSHGDESSDVTANRLPAFTVCNLNPLRYHRFSSRL